VTDAEEEIMCGVIGCQPPKAVAARTNTGRRNRQKTLSSQGCLHTYSVPAQASLCENTPLWSGQAALSSIARAATQT